ncbi:MAG: acetyl-CoA carboxylase biotin carboxylase subunit [Bacteroidales bacterium]|nr:acetyl-CoA carboxylase biotin carboxylase subunit [Bacteroidales bacterium]
MFNKILIANRGEIALRIIRTCKEMGIKTVAIYSTADRDSLHVRFADEAVCIGPAPSAQSYLNIPAIISVAELTNADAIHPGYGFLSENAKFARICTEHGIKFIGPTEEHINKMGDKATARKTMIANGVPITPGTDDLIDTVEEGKREALRIGYPVMLKATAGGGGKGMRIIRNEEEFEHLWNAAKQEAAASFANDAVYLEKYIEEPHHIEIQIAGDQYGNVCHLSERDCSIQRRHQKLLEETPSPFMTEALRHKMGEAAIKAAKAIKYEGVGTCEFLVDKNRNFYFMEMNTRIQVEHGITEEVTKLDLVKEQIMIAAGAKISQRNYYPQAHAIECRINAEDPFNNFRPCPGQITGLHLPGGNGIRVDTHVYTGYKIPANYDSMIAKIVAVAQTRAEAIDKMRRALFELVIEGVKTTAPFHQQLLENEDFRAGNYTTKFMEDFVIQNPENN